MQEDDQSLMIVVLDFPLIGNWWFNQIHNIQSVLDIAMPIAQTQFIDCLKKLAQKLKDEGKF